MADLQLQTTLLPAATPLSLIPVTLKEAALDSPTFRATAVHFADQLEALERWLDNYLRAATRLVTEMTALESAVNALLSASAAPANIGEAVLDHDYSLLAVKRYGEGAREYWGSVLRGTKKLEQLVIEPIKAFLHNEVRSFKETRNALVTNQKAFDAAISRYLSQSKTKEASSLREDAFQVHEARKAYLKTSMDFCVAAPGVRAGVDRVVVRVFGEGFREMRGGVQGVGAVLGKWSGEVERVRGWGREMEDSERVFRRELAGARKGIEEAAGVMTRPSRELADYEVSTVPYLGTGASTAKGMTSPAKIPGKESGEKQGWLFIKTVVGKPARTVWSRRWFFVKNGIFGWLVQGSKSGGVEESEKIGVLLCGVRPAFQEERRFCFEVKTKDTSIILQAETQTELSDWIGTFEVAKRKALEDPGSTEASPLAADPAFAITAPIAPEFAAKLDGLERSATEDLSTGLSVPEREGTGFGGVQQRASFDINAARRVTSLGQESVESSRDRLMQKLDLHKRATSTTPSGQASGPAGGIASLISASHNVLPIRPPEAPVVPETTSLPIGHRRNPTIPTSTLAPSTLANPPAPTNLSHTAVVVSGERGLGLGGSKADGSGMPSGILANLWGSSNWGYVNRLGDDVAKPSSAPRSVSQPPSPQPSITRTVDDVGVMDGTGELSKDLLPTNSSDPPGPGHLGHRKTTSAVTAIDLQSASTPKLPSENEQEEYPNYYPLPLKAQHAQFRTLFPSVPRSEKVVLVFRATWNPNEQQEFPGRVYVTAREVYFYSHHLGFVLITGVSLTSIAEVTGAPGRDCDFLYLHLKESAGQGARRITIRVFLEGLRLLQRRLAWLVDNANSDEPQGLEDILKRLIRMEVEKQERSSSIESWEDLADDAPIAGDEGGAHSSTRDTRRERNVKASLRIDGSLFGDSGAAKTGREVQKFQLPRQAVVYAPQGMRAAPTTREFAISAKALFHLMFGDKSAVFYLLYCNRWADRIVQSPWTKSDSPSAHWARRFTSEGAATPMADVQTIEIWNDHLCYVVGHVKKPWRLPLKDRFTLTTKFVITHVSKSRCKLAIFQQISWSVSPSWTYIRDLIEERAFRSLEADALDLTNVAMDQVSKLGSHSKTNRAVDIFGAIGQAASGAKADVSAVPNLGGSVTSGRERRRQPVGIVTLVAADVAVKSLRAVGWAMDVAVAVVKAVVEACNAHSLLVVVLLLSLLYNTWYGYRDGIVWWQERSALKYMSRLGVKPEMALTKAVYLADIEDAIAMPASGNETDGMGLPFSSFFSSTDGSPQDGLAKTCRSTFVEEVLDPATATASSGGAMRLRRSRDSMARYRHDLVVALRVVNRVERDVVVAEWEDWVRGEERKCAQVEDMLLMRRKANSTSAKAGQRIEKDVSVEEELGEEFAAYCRSCRGEVVEINGGESLT